MEPQIHLVKESLLDRAADDVRDLQIPIDDRDDDERFDECESTVTTGNA
jgi:hypothetical protein